MPIKILVIPDTMIRKTGLPGRRTRLQSKRKPSLDKLNRTLQRYLICGRNQGMEVIRHNYKFMEEIFPLSAIVKEDINEQVGGDNARE